MPRSESTVNAARRDGNNNRRAYGSHQGQRRYDHWRRQMAVYSAAARRQDRPRRPR
jgi:hypothetical protein